MYLFPNTKYFLSEKNGTITVVRFLNSARVFAGGAEQSGPYVKGLWQDALRYLPDTIVVRNVLMIGLAGGSALAQVERRFPQASITVIEWDPVMVEIAQELHGSANFPHVIIGDSYDVLPTLQGNYDLIIEDAFFGDLPEQRIGEEVPGRALVRLLTHQGYVLANISRTLSLIPKLQTFLTLEDSWKFKYNTVVLFSNPSGGHGGNRSQLIA